MRPSTLVAAVLLLGSCTALIAQEQAPSLQPGTRVRLTVPCDQKAQPVVGAQNPKCSFVGRWAMSRADVITLEVAESTTSYTLGTVSQLQVSRGYRSHALVGAGAGFLIGAGVTYFVLNSGGSTSLCDRSANQDAYSSGECLGLAALGALGGAGLGAIIGALVRTERWQDVPIERLRFNVAPQGDIEFNLSVAF